MDVCLEAREISKIYRRGAISVAAVQSVSLGVEKGQIVLLIGPSGSGKTTLLSMLGCILRPTSGDLYVNGTLVSDLPESRLPLIRRSCFGFCFSGFPSLPILDCARKRRDSNEVAASL
jgi:putative ABC transport system ATP-binding protein